MWWEEKDYCCDGGALSLSGVSGRGVIGHDHGSVMRAIESEPGTIEGETAGLKGCERGARRVGGRDGGDGSG